MQPRRRASASRCARRWPSGGWSSCSNPRRMIMTNRIGKTLAGAWQSAWRRSPCAAQSPRPDSVVSDRVKQLTRGTQWKQVAAIPMQLQHAASARHGEDRRRLLRVVGRDQDADQALSAAGRTATTATPAKAPGTCSSSTRPASSSPTCRSAKGRSITRAASTTTGATSGCRSPSTARTARRSSTASTRPR